MFKPQEHAVVDLEARLSQLEARSRTQRRLLVFGALALTATLSISAVQNQASADPKDIVINDAKSGWSLRLGRVDAKGSGGFGVHLIDKSGANRGFLGLRENGNVEVDVRAEGAAHGARMRAEPATRSENGVYYGDKWTAYCETRKKTSNYFINDKTSGKSWFQAGTYKDDSYVVLRNKEGLDTVWMLHSANGYNALAARGFKDCEIGMTVQDRSASIGLRSHDGKLKIGLASNDERADLHMYAKDEARRGTLSASDEGTKFEIVDSKDRKRVSLGLANDQAGLVISDGKGTSKSWPVPKSPRPGTPGSAGAESKGQGAKKTEGAKKATDGKKAEGSKQVEDAKKAVDAGKQGAGRK